MMLDDIIEPVAFGTTTPKVKACLGLYLSPETIYIAETHLERRRIAVDHLVRIPVPIDEEAKSNTATLNTDFLMDNAKIAGVIRQSMSQIRWGTKNVMVTLSHHLGLLRYFAMPAVDRRFWRTAVPLEAKKYIPIPLDSLEYDLQVIALPPDPTTTRPRQGALIGVTQRKNIANIAGLIESLGLNLVGIELAPCSVLRMWETLETQAARQTHGQVHFDGGSIRILLADQGLPVFFREVFLAGQASFNDLRKLDLSGCADFAQKQLAMPALKTLRVSGTIAGLPQWAEAFSQEIDVPATTQDTAQMLGIKSADWGGYASIGASTKPLVSSPLAIDLAKIGKITKEERRTARDLFYVVAFVASLFLGAGLWEGALYQLSARELRRYKRDSKLEAIFEGRSKEQIDLMLRLMREEVGVSRWVTVSAGSKTSDLLKHVAQSLPEKAWLTAVVISQPVITSVNLIPEAQFNGGAVGPSPAEEQQLAYKVRENLLKDPEFVQTFPEITVAVSGRFTHQADDQGLDPVALAQKLEQRTAFQIVARGRR